MESAVGATPPTSVHVAARDGVRLAVDVWQPRNTPDPCPALLQLTRYWRSERTAAEGTLSVPPEIEYFTAQGYVVVVADLRGTGASFGSRQSVYVHEDIDDIADLLDWIVREPWSNGRVATLGRSFAGNVAELALATRHPAIVAAVPQHTDFSEYRDALMPGGLRNRFLGELFAQFTAALDANDGRAVGVLMGDTQSVKGSRWAQGVRPVDADTDGRLLAAALQDHARNRSVGPLLSGLSFLNDEFGRSKGGLESANSMSPAGMWTSIDAAAIPALHIAGWLDQATAHGALTRLETYRSPVEVLIGPWTHDGTGRTELLPSRARAVGEDLALERFQAINAFLSARLRADRATPLKRIVRYYVFGADEWRVSDRWPPSNVEDLLLYFDEHHTLARSRPTGSEDTDRYSVDQAATTGAMNRWHLGPIDYGDRRDADRQLLVYDSEPLAVDLEIVGHARMWIHLASTSTDGALFAYLECISPDGTVHYLTDGQLRLSLRHSAERNDDTHSFGPQPTFLRQHAGPMVAGEMEEVALTMQPIAVRVPAGYQLRLALAGADVDTFAAVSSEGRESVWTVGRSSGRQSRLALPVMRAVGDSRSSSASR